MAQIIWTNEALRWLEESSSTSQPAAPMRRAERSRVYSSGLRFFHTIRNWSIAFHRHRGRLLNSVVRLHRKGGVMKRLLCATIVAISQCAWAQAKPNEEDCRGLLGILPTFQIPEMKVYYESNPDASGKDMVQKLRSLAEAGDKTAQFTYGNLLLTGYCVPQDFCAARKYREQSRGGATDWEAIYPIPRYLRKKYDDAVCN